MLEIADLCCVYADAPVLDGVSLQVAAGEAVVVIGGRGSGKTTLLRAIMGQRPPRIIGGSVRWRGKELTTLRAHQISRRGLALVPQERMVFPAMTVNEQLALLKPAAAQHGWTVARALELFPRLGAKQQLRGAQLSDEERGMLAVARALMADPRLLLIDEAGVSAQALRELKTEGLAIVLAEPRATEGTDRAWLLEGGKTRLVE